MAMAMFAVYRTKAESCQDGLVSGRRLPTSRHIPPSEIDDHKASIATITHTKPLNGTPSYLPPPGCEYEPTRSHTSPM
ncbi:hypothetical protein PISMIDRAFT_671381, partial [Pisolithus microcarpus 441]